MNMSSDPTTPPLIPGFARVRIGRGRTRLVRVLHEKGGQVFGKRVNKDGSVHEVVSRGAVTEELVVVRESEVLERLVLNTFYGELEPDGANSEAREIRGRCRAHAI